MKVKASWTVMKSSSRSRHQPPLVPAGQALVAAAAAGRALLLPAVQHSTRSAASSTVWCRTTTTSQSLKRPVQSESRLRMMTHRVPAGRKAAGQLGEGAAGTQRQQSGALVGADGSGAKLQTVSCCTGKSVCPIALV